MDALKAVNLGVRFVLELCALAALAYWGWKAGDRMPAKLLLGIGAPLVAAVVWGLFVAPKATFDVGDGLRLALELVVFGCAVAALVAAGRIGLGVALGVVYAVNRVLMAVWDQ
jgi:hypothetical protein